MPQMIELARAFQGRPVVILGVNTDPNEEDARFVVDAMKLNYPTLKGEGIAEKYEARAFPMLIVIDQEGKFADIHIGFSPTLGEELSKTVKELLAKK
jgi:hypothetical protein